MLITDGAPCYPSLSAKFGWRHEACNHSKGIFCIKKRIGNKTILIHTGGADAMWRLPKSAIPCSLATKLNSQVNPKLMRGIRVWQWRWLNSNENLWRRQVARCRSAWRCERGKKSHEFSKQNSL